MTEEVIKEDIISTPAPAAPKCEDLLINSPDTMDGKSVLPDLKRKEKPVPHYMRASSSSCHDNCKFGTHHSSEPKKYWPVRRAQLRRASAGNQERDRPIEILLPQRGRPRKDDQKLKNSHVKDGNAIVAKPEPTNSKAPLEIAPDHSESTPYLENLPAEASEIGNLPTDAECFVISRDDVADIRDGKLSDGAESIELEMPLAFQDSDASDEQTEDAILPCEDAGEAEKPSSVNHIADESANECISSEKTPQTVMAPKKHEQADTEIKSKRSASKPTKAKVASNVTRNTTSSQQSGRTLLPKAHGAEIEISSRQTAVRAKANASGTTTKLSRDKKGSPTVASAVPKVKEFKVPSTNSFAKSARSEKPKATATNSAPSPSVSSGKQTDRKMTVKNVAKDAQVVQKKREEKVTPRSINMPAKSISSVKVRTFRKEKIAPPIKSSKKVSGTENSAADAKEKIQKTALPKARKPEGNNKESRPGKEKPDTPTLRTRTAGGPTPAPISSSSTAQPPRKLTFRRGKVLNPDDSSSSTPRRLRFRPAVAAADATVRSRGGRVIASRRSGGRSGGGARSAGASRAAEVVVLRRRQGGVGGDRKRQEQVLLNNVIEETASRLVAEARKSKVKALVGAFETVISLQEGGKVGPPAAAAAAATVAQ